MDINLEKEWWIAPALLGAVGLAAVLLARSSLAGLAPYALLLCSLLVGASTLWAYLRRDVWFAVAPAVVAFALAIAVVVDLFLPANNGWITILILGASAFVIALIPNRRIEINVAHFVGIAILVIGFLISPLRTVWKVVLIVASLTLAAYLLWLDRRDMRRLLTS